jgi:selenium metabolism protein YedF
MNAQTPSGELRGTPGEDLEPASRPAPAVIAISSNGMGRGDDELGQVLLRNYLHTLTEVTPSPDVIVFFNSGVRLAVEGSPALDDLGVLQRQGVRILLCGTCLGHFDLKDKVAVGEISNMYAISETMLRAAKVINL